MFIIDLDSESYFIDDIMKNCRPLKIGEPERMRESKAPSVFLLSPTENNRSISIGMKPVDRLIMRDPVLGRLEIFKHRHGTRIECFVDSVKEVDAIMRSHGYAVTDYPSQMFGIRKLDVDRR